MKSRIPSFPVLRIVLLLALASCRSPIPTQTAFHDDSYFTIAAGSRKWDSDWEPVDEPFVMQGTYLYEPEAWPVGIEAGVQWSTADKTQDGSGFSSNSFEVSMGASKTFWPVTEKLLLTIGAGLAINWTREFLDSFDPNDPANSSTTRGDDFWPGAYAHTRLAWKFSKTFDVGVDLRGLLGPSGVSLIGPVRQGNYLQFTFGLGIHQ